MAISKKGVLGSGHADPSSTIDIRVEMDDIECLQILSFPGFFIIFWQIRYNTGITADKNGALHKKQENPSFLIYEDNGKGIPLDEKEKIFEFGVWLPEPVLACS